MKAEHVNLLFCWGRSCCHFFSVVTGPHRLMRLWRSKLNTLSWIILSKSVSEVKGNSSLNPSNVTQTKQTIIYITMKWDSRNTQIWDNTLNTSMINLSVLWELMSPLCTNQWEVVKSCIMSLSAFFCSMFGLLLIIRRLCERIPASLANKWCSTMWS